jgi:plastocyanin
MARIRMLCVVGVLVCGTALASCAQSGQAADRPQPKTHTVIMEGMVFRPNVITIAAGDTVVWINKDFVPHTATSSAAGFDSTIVAANKSWRYTFERTGDFDYICSLHPTMTAALHVR